MAHVSVGNCPLPHENPSVILTLLMTTGNSVWRHYASLLRVPYHCSFIVVILGMATAARGVSGPLLWDAVRLYLSFNVLLYGGLYTFNAVTDVRSDRCHPTKMHRPVAAGLVTVRQAQLFGFGLLFAGVFTGAVLFSSRIVALYAGFILINAAYSTVFRNVPYLDLLTNAATYPLRYVLGGVAAGGNVPVIDTWLVFLVALGGATLRRRIEASRWGHSGRPSLSAYSPARLLVLEIVFLTVIMALWAAEQTMSSYVYAVAAAVYVILVFVPRVAPHLWRAFERLWMA